MKGPTGTLEAWYFSTSDRRLRHGDGRPIAIGTAHTVEGKIRACGNGLHASVCAFDALRFAPGPILWRVHLSGAMDVRDGKIAAARRAYVAGGMDASAMLRAFARWCALSVAHLWECPDVVARYLVTGDESLRAAARAAAWDAAWPSAGSAALDGTQYAALDAAWSSAGPSAGPSARSSAQYAAGSAKREQFNRMAHDLISGNEWWGTGTEGRND